MSVPAAKGFKKPAPKLLGETPLPVKTPGKSTIVKPAVSQTEPRHGPTSRYTSSPIFIYIPGCWRNFSSYSIKLFIIILATFLFAAHSVCISYAEICHFHCSFPCRVALCKTPGCFLQSLSNPGNSYGCNFKQNKEDLTRKLYQLYNTSVFDSKVMNNPRYPCLVSCAVLRNVHCLNASFSPPLRG